MVKAIYNDHSQYKYSNGVKLKALFLKSGTTQGCPLSTSIQHILGSPKPQ